MERGGEKGRERERESKIGREGDRKRDTEYRDGLTCSSMPLAKLPAAS